MKKVFFMDGNPIIQKKEIRSGGHVRRYYALKALNETDNEIILSKKNVTILLDIFFSIFDEKIIWTEYKSNTITHLLSIALSFLFNKKLVVNVHDLSMQARYFGEDYSFFKKMRIKIIENILLNRADIIILAWPKLLDYLTPKKKQKIIIMPPGIGEDELLEPGKKEVNEKKIALYFGGMQRKGQIPKIIELFSNLSDWDLYLVGKQEGEKIVETKNVKYFNEMSQSETFDICLLANVVLSPLQKNEYTNRFMPMKIGYCLKTCRPLITTKLDGILEYISMVGLEKNVICIEEWNLNSLEHALSEAEKIKIDSRKTIECMKPLAWEPRFKKVMEIIFDKSPYTEQIIYI